MGEATALNGLTFGVQGVTNSNDVGSGVSGFAAASTGFTHGVIGLSNSPGGNGVLGVDVTASTTGSGFPSSGQGAGVWGDTSQPFNFGVLGTADDGYASENACRAGFFYGNFIKRFCTIGWVLIGMMVTVMTARALYGSHVLYDPEDAFGYACRHLLFPGGVGLLIASVLAANMAACSSFMINGGALFTRNVYRKYVVQSADDKHCLLVGRISGVAITLLSVLYSVFLVSRVLYSFLLTETLSTFVGVGLLGGIVWPRAIDGVQSQAW